jgi:hypothetical protein
MHTALSPLDLYGVSTIEIALLVIPIKCSEVQDVRPIEGQYQVNATAIWGLIPRELSRNVLKFLSAKELVGFKSICKNAKSTVQSKKGLFFKAIREQLDKIIEECGFENVPNAFKFKVRNLIRFGEACGPVGYDVHTTNRCMPIVQYEDMFKAGVNIKVGRDMGTVHVHP